VSCMVLLIWLFMYKLFISSKNCLQAWLLSTVILNITMFIQLYISILYCQTEGCIVLVLKFTHTNLNQTHPDSDIPTFY
jgi:hypothetical protein